MIGIDLFSGAGGMTLGAKLAGIKVAIAVESDPHAAETYATNHPEVNLQTIDIRRLRKLPPLPSGSVILFGGPPCQGFSTSNQRTRSRDNDSNWMFREFIRIARMIRPDWIVFENVKGIAETENGAFLALIHKQISALGYTLSKGILNAANYGVPQRRERLFLVGSLDGIEVSMPTPTSKKPVSVNDAIEDLPVLGNGANEATLPYKSSPRSAYAKIMRDGCAKASGHHVTRNANFVLKRYRYVPPGGNWKDIPPRLMANYRENYECHTGIYHRLDPEVPSIVIGNYRKNMLIHPTQDRGLSVREAARIQSFPDSYRFLGSIGFQQQQVGNAVPPLLAKAIFTQILAHSS